MSTLTTPSGSADGLTWLEAGRILETLKDELASKDVVLVGGQALNFWQAHFIELGHPDFRDAALLTSKDIDFCGDRKVVEAFAVKLGGTAKFPPRFDPTPSTGLVLFIDFKGDTRQIDFIEAPLGLAASDVRELALPVDVQTQGAGGTVRLWVMHPVHCMFSRVWNTVTLPEYQTPQGRRQLALSLTCAQAFLIELLDLDAADTVMGLSERIFFFCHDVDVGRRVSHEYGVDPFDAVPLEHPRLPEKFKTLRYPQMVDRISRRRKRALRST